MFTVMTSTFFTIINISNNLLDLEKSQQLAMSLEERMREAERERKELEEAQRKAEEARLEAERAAHLEKTEREAKVGWR